MGFFDTLIYRRKMAQVKCLGQTLHSYKTGDTIPGWVVRRYGADFTIVLPKYEGADFALIKGSKFLKLTCNKKLTYPPYISKWGGVLTGPLLSSNPFEEAIKKVKAETRR
jgi:hypothetical protein